MCGSLFWQCMGTMYSTVGSALLPGYRTSSFSLKESKLEGKGKQEILKIVCCLLETNNVYFYRINISEVKEEAVAQNLSFAKFLSR